MCGFLTARITVSINHFSGWKNKRVECWDLQNVWQWGIQTIATDFSEIHGCLSACMQMSDQKLDVVRSLFCSATGSVETEEEEEEEEEEDDDDEDDEEEDDDGDAEEEDEE